VRVDPRQVPVLQTDRHLPAVSGLELDFLRERIGGLTAQRVAHQPGPARVAAAVLIAIVIRPRPAVLLTQRAAHLSSHAGQIAFAGGKADAGDVDPVATALREAQEEVGLNPKLVHVLGTLPAYATHSSYLITPVVGWVGPSFVAARNPLEVADVFEVPLDFLMNPAHHRHHAVNVNGVKHQWLSMLYQENHQTERLIWGATAGMLRSLYNLLAT
jgi:8-oxo-dGTP pyrophosphatase MutT (NUDIX family)